MQSEIIWIIVCYLLGSFPIAYLVGKNAKIDPGKVGAQKYSGSNVFRLVGKRAGITVGIVDLLKGVLAVAGARYFHLSELAIAFSALTAIAGQNWSLFTGFKGGRGLAATIGASFTISPLVASLPFLIFVLSRVIKNMGLGTLFMFGLMILIGFLMHNHLFFTFSILAFILALMARFIASGRPMTKKLSTLLNRLLFDYDSKETIYQTKNST